MPWLFESYDKACIEAIDRGDVRIAARIGSNARKPALMTGDAIVDPFMDVAMHPKIGPAYEVGQVACVRRVLGVERRGLTEALR